MTELLENEIQRIPPAPPRNVDLLPGLAYSKSVSRTMIMFPLFFLAVIPFFFLVIVSQSPEMKLALRATRNAEGRIESVDRGRACRGGADVVYTFATPDGVTRRGRDRVCPPSAYASPSPGDSIPVTYLESDPNVSEVTGGRARGPDVLFPLFIFPIFFLFLFSVFLWPPIQRQMRDRKLFRTGAFAKGRVTYVKSTREIPWAGGAQMYVQTNVYVRARFDTGEREVKAACTNEWLVAHLPPGAEVHVCAVGDKAMLVENYLR